MTRWSEKIKEGRTGEVLNKEGTGESIVETQVSDVKKGKTGEVLNKQGTGVKVLQEDR